MPTTKGFQCRGVTSWSDGKQGRILITTGDSHLTALDVRRASASAISCDKTLMGVIQLSLLD
jgi:hypothetical protein